VKIQRILKKAGMKATVASSGLAMLLVCVSMIPAQTEAVSVWLTKSGPLGTSSTFIPPVRRRA